MKPKVTLLAAGLLFLTAAQAAPATTHYVNMASLSPASPYTDWSSAATNIQDAVDVAAEGDEVVVTNGVYATGGRAVYGFMTNRVAVDRAVTVRSMNGPHSTVIEGYQLPGTTNGDGAVRCALLVGGASLIGFTLTNGATRIDGDYDRERSGGGAWCESDNALLANCELNANCADDSGGGAYRGVVRGCGLCGNRAGFGGGTFLCTVSNCTFKANSAYDGGGAFRGTIYNSTFMSNSSGQGGGASEATLNNCFLTANRADRGGGVLFSTLQNCTITGNSATTSGGGADGSSLNNCLIYYNTAPQGTNYSYPKTNMNFCCTTPMPPWGTGHLTAEPLLASASHLSADSPCRGAGSSAYVSGVDIDGQSWCNPPSIGCNEFHPGLAMGSIRVTIKQGDTNVAISLGLEFKGLINGQVSASRWDFGDGTVVSNRPFTTHAWMAAGDYHVTLTAYNESYTAGLSAMVVVHVLQDPVLYVALDSSAPLAPYGSWATAARTIQDAVDAAPPGALVLVSNGVYEAGGRVVDGSLTNRVAVTKPLRLESVNGPDFTTIRGHQEPAPVQDNSAIRCIYLADGAALIGFTLADGATLDCCDKIREQSGGGVFGQTPSVVVSNCVITRNSASYLGGGAYGASLTDCILTMNSAAQSGAGAYGGSLSHCILTTNSGPVEGGGADSSVLHNCLLVGNSAQAGGGLARCEATNCTIAGNQASIGGGAAWGSLKNCILYWNRLNSAIPISTP